MLSAAILTSESDTEILLSAALVPMPTWNEAVVVDPSSNLMPLNSVELAIRVDPGNQNHHLWNNNGTWFVHYTVYPTPVTKERVRRSLRTRDPETARRRRDTLFARLRDEARYRAVHPAPTPARREVAA